jgi:hypothetical protein
MIFKDKFNPFLSNLLEEVMAQAMEDGVITPEETVLLSQIEIDIRSLEKEVADCINEEGGSAADCFKDRLIANVKQIALEDGEISKDEEAILAKLETYFSKK